MPRPRQRHIYFAGLALDSALFALGAFLANFLFARNDALIYTMGGVLLFVGNFILKSLLFRKEWYRIKMFESLSDEVARGATAYGISRLYNMQDATEQDLRNKDTRKAISDAHSLFLCANSGASYLNAAVSRHRPSIIQRLKAGIGLQVLLLDPLSPEKRLRDQVNVAGERTDSKLSLGDIIRLCNEFPRIEVRFVQSGMTCSLFFADDILFFDPYHLSRNDGRIENRFLCLRVGRVAVASGLSYFELFQAHRDVLWQRGTPIEQWLSANRDALESRLGIAELPEYRPASPQGAACGNAQ